jgi:hypothetical protein
MEALLQNLSIARLLRWSFVGALFLIAADPSSFSLRYCNSHSLTEMIESLPLITLLGTSTLVGGFLYGIYRSLVFPMIESLMIWCYRDSCGNICKCGLIGVPRGLLHMLSLWDQNAGDSLAEMRRNRHKRITEWGDIVHSQLAGAIMGIGGGSAFYAITLCLRDDYNSLQLKPNVWLLLLSGLLLISGWVSIARLLLMQELIDKKYATTLLWQYPSEELDKQPKCGRCRVLPRIIHRIFCCRTD